MKLTLMKCGHVAVATTDDGRPVCPICMCFDVERELDENNTTYGLEGRTARCFSCGKETASSWDLPFFEYRSDKDVDCYYCGCDGWD